MMKNEYSIKGIKSLPEKDRKHPELIMGKSYYFNISLTKAAKGKLTEIQDQGNRISITLDTETGRHSRFSDEIGDSITQAGQNTLLF